MSRIEADPPPGAPLAEAQSVRRKLSPVLVWGLALTAGLIAGFASWQIGETYHGRFEPTLIPGKALGTPPEVLEANFNSRQTAVTREATFAYGVLGAVLGLALGLAGGAVRGSVGTALVGAIVGTILGGAAGAGMTRVLLPIYHSNILLRSDKGDLLLAILIHGGSWSVIGAVGGAAFGIGLGDRRRAIAALFGGLVGAIAGVLAYEIIGSLAFPLDAITDPISATPETRLFARLAVTILASAGAAWGALDRVKEASKGPVSAEHHS